VPHPPVCQCLQRGVLVLFQSLLLFARQFCADPFFLICCQEIGFIGAVWEQIVGEETAD
jgi:hypothetical protein